jgi:maltose-binding protein MalE
MEDAYASSLPQFDMRVLIDQLPNAKPIPSSLDTAEWANFALKEFTKAWAGEETVAQAGKNAADQMNAALAKEK